MYTQRVLLVSEDSQIELCIDQKNGNVRSENKIALAQSGDEAFRLLEKKRFQVVIADINIKATNVRRFFSELKERHPGILRIALVEEDEKEDVLASSWAIHQFLLKPCNVDSVAVAVKRFALFRDLLENETLRKIVIDLKALPSFPALYFYLMEEISSPDSSAERTARIISRDISMTAKILQIINSPFFGFTTRITSLAQAISLLGLDTIQSLVLSHHVFSHYTLPRFGHFNIGMLWQHSIATAVCAKKIAGLEMKDKAKQNEAFLSGMLHDIGYLIIAQSLPEIFTEVMRIAKHENVSVYDAEMEVFGASHGHLGGYLLATWGIPAQIIEAVTYHHEPSAIKTEGFTPMTAVHVANYFVIVNNQSEAIAVPDGVDNGYINRIGMRKRYGVWTQACDI